MWAFPLTLPMGLNTVRYCATCDSRMILLKFACKRCCLQVLGMFINDLYHILHIYANGIIFEVAAQDLQFPLVRRRDNVS